MNPYAKKTIIFDNEELVMLRHAVNTLWSKMDRNQTTDSIMKDVLQKIEESLK